MSILSRPLYRGRQFFGALRTRTGETDLAEARHLLGQQLTALFLSMTPRDRRHCLDVCQTLRRLGCEDGELLTAALLHDAGKGNLAASRIQLWHRVAYVLLEAGAPALLARLARGRGGIAELHDHAERGALLAEMHGAPAAVVQLVRSHEARGREDERSSLLRAADDAC